MPTIVIQDTPQLQATVLTCLAQAGWIARRQGACGAIRSRAVSLDVAHLERRVVGAVRGSHVIDLTDTLSGADACTPIVGGQVAYQDGDHLTATITRSLAPMLMPASRPLQPANTLKFVSFTGTELTVG